MPPRSKDDDETGTEEPGLDRINALPNEVIHHLIGLLPAPEAVRTSVLAKGWRHHWKYMRNLQFFVAGDRPVLSADWLNNFMSHLLADLRAPLDACEIYVEEGLCDDVIKLQAGRWVHQAVSDHHVRELMVDIELQYDEASFVLAGRHFVSEHLAKLEFCSVVLDRRVLDFSRCQALEDLVLNKCDIGTKNIVSHTLKYLRIDACDFCRKGSGTRISAQNLISLKLEHNIGTDPVFLNMPLLEKAVVSLYCNHDYNNDDPCDNGDRGACCGLCEGCSSSPAHSGGCRTLLPSLSSATDLELQLPFAKFTDLKCYPTFHQLKSLLVDEWCVAANHRALIYILQHAPVLENLTITMGCLRMNMMELEGNHNPMVQLSAISEHFKSVKILGDKNDVRFLRLSKLFSSLDIQMNI